LIDRVKFLPAAEASLQRRAGKDILPALVDARTTVTWTRYKAAKLLRAKNTDAGSSDETGHASAFPKSKESPWAGTDDAAGDAALARHPDQAAPACAIQALWPYYFDA